MNHGFLQREESSPVTKRDPNAAAETINFRKLHIDYEALEYSTTPIFVTPVNSGYALCTNPSLSVFQTLVLFPKTPSFYFRISCPCTF